MSCQCFGPTQVIVFLPGIADITTLFEAGKEATNASPNGAGQTGWKTHEKTPR